MQSEEASPEVVAAWVAGWAISRGVGPPAPVRHGFYLEVGLPQHLGRYIFPSAEHAFLRGFAGAITEPWMFVKVCAHADTLHAAWPEGWALQQPGFMMTTDLARSAAPPPSLPPGYSLAIKGDRLIFAEVVHEGGEPAARGRIALADGFAVFDNIGTEESHRRLGLGRVVMTALSEAAMARGVGRGLLVATPMGRELYSAMGWDLHAHFTTAVIPGDDPVT